MNIFFGGLMNIILCVFFSFSIREKNFLFCFSHSPAKLKNLKNHLILKKFYYFLYFYFLCQIKHIA